MSECLAILRSCPEVRLDDRWGDDLLAVITGEREDERPTWAS